MVMSSLMVSKKKLTKKIVCVFKQTKKEINVHDFFSLNFLLNLTNSWLNCFSEYCPKFTIFWDGLINFFFFFMLQIYYL